MKLPAISHSEQRALREAVRVDFNLDGAFMPSGRVHRLRTMQRLVARGLMRDEWAYLCDGDGFTVQPERYRPCFALTAKGRKVAALYAALAGSVKP